MFNQFTLACGIDRPQKPNSCENSKDMKIFQAFQRNFAIVGITQTVAKQRCPVNVKIFLGILLLGSAILCNLLFVIYEAKTFAEYTQTLYICSVSCLTLSALIITILKMKKMFEFINDGNGVVNTSELII